MPREIRVTRKTIANYAKMLGQDSPVACALRFHDEMREDGTKVTVYRRNNGFTLKTESGSFHYDWKRP